MNSNMGEVIETCTYKLTHVVLYSKVYHSVNDQKISKLTLVTNSTYWLLDAEEQKSGLNPRHTSA